ncbi:MAG: flagellar basal body-associated FliL family protein [Leptospirales bacterium]
MADEELLDEDQDEDLLSGAPIAGGRSKLVGILLWAVGILVAIALMFVIAYFVSENSKSNDYRETQSIVIAPAPAPWGIYRFQKEFRVNTADTDEAHFIQMTLSFGFDSNNKQLENELIQRTAQMMHIINIVLGGKKKEELITSMQKQNLADEVKSMINMILSKGKIEAVYFEELIVS